MSARHAILPVVLLVLLAPARADSLMPGMTGMPARAVGEQAAPWAKGTVLRIDAHIGRLVIQHDALAALDMPAMTTAFRLRDPSLLTGLKVGDRIGFRVVPSDNGLIVTALTKNN